jgi:hypothetical protein
MIWSFLYWALRRLLELILLLFRSNAANQMEMLVLRQEVMMLPHFASNVDSEFPSSYSTNGIRF